ncbi:MAG: biotin/lipoyl-binding protein [Chlamydiae bacterium]|nr:biotin/lipoyl-binding protein [Chlamydiota bacterium]
MFRKIGLPALALCGLILAVAMVFVGRKKMPTPPIEFPPPKPPFKHYVAGSGIIEASSQNIAIGSVLAEIVEKVFVCPGDYVKKGDPLFQLDTRQFLARAKTAESAKAVALANFNRLMQLPRPEDIPPLEARLQQAQVRLRDEYTQFNLYENVADKRAISFNDYNQRKYAARFANFQFEEAKATLDLLRAGAWVEDLKISAAQIEETDAQIGVIQTEIERAVVRAPSDGQVLQVNIREGEFAFGGAEDALFRDPLILFGAVNPVHMRIDVDEDDAWRVFSGAQAIAYVRGNSSICIPLEFVRIDPYIIPKRSLTGDDLERVDTRVLQLIYRFQKKDLPVYLGQLMDIFIEAKPSRGL